MTSGSYLPDFYDPDSPDHAESTFTRSPSRGLARQSVAEHLPNPVGVKAGKRRPGAPPGNFNALKHGFYSRRFNRAELEDLEVVDEGDLEDEIALLRVSRVAPTSRRRRRSRHAPRHRMVA